MVMLINNGEGRQWRMVVVLVQLCWIMELRQVTNTEHQHRACYSYFVDTSLEW